MNSLNMKFPFFSLLLVHLVAGTATFAQQAPPSLFADQKATAIGDVVTIIVMENANARRSSQSTRDDNNNIDVGGSVEGNLLDFLPLWGLDARLRSDSDMREGTSQMDQITGRITAVITDITDNGQFVISGSKVINVNGEQNLMTVKGFVRPNDIQWDNTVYSYNVADSRIYYSQAGITGKLIARGTIPRMANLIMGGAGLLIIGYVGGLSALAIIRSFVI
ncbi:flagellar basal body L-ring protein FlgH [Candidatus Neomarinimicrobiota bacterium]